MTTANAVQRSHEIWPGHKVLKLAHIICGLILLLATGLLIGAGTMTGNGQMTSWQPVLYKIGYFSLLCVFGFSVLLSFKIYQMQRQNAQGTHLTVSGLTTSPNPESSLSSSILGPNSNSQITKSLLFASSFLAVRIVYGFLGIFEATGTKMFSSMWSPLFGSPAALALMCLLPEYIAICFYLYILQYRVRTSKKTNRSSPGDLRNLMDDGHELSRHNGRRKSHTGRHPTPGLNSRGIE